MDIYFQAVAAILIAVVLGITLRKQSGEMALLLTLIVCCMTAMAAVHFLRPVLDFWEQLRKLGNFSGTWLQILTKVVGIGVVSEIASLVCSDSGNASLAKTIQLLSSGAILWLSIPLLRELMELMQKILGEP